ncbi:hypothetical protein JCM6882_000561 [Rhodosporidiobolus microsporus]
MAKNGFGLDEKPQPSLYEPFFVHVQRQGTLRPSTSSQAASGGGGFLNRLGLAQPKLDLEVAEDVVYLRPSIDEIPGEDELLKGSVTLWLPKPRRLKSLSVRMFGKYDISWPTESARTPPFESGVLSERMVNLLGEGEEVELEKGGHTFEFMFFIPADSACWERCIHGRIRYYLLADCTFSTSTSFASSSSLSSDPKTIYLVPNPGPESSIPSPPPPLQLHSEGHFDDTGPWALELQSQHITVGGLLLMRLILPSPPSTVLLHSIKVTIAQSFALASPANPHLGTVEIAPASHVVFILDAAHPPNRGLPSLLHNSGRGAQRRNLSAKAPPLAVVSLKEGGAEVVHVARLPSDNYLRPSTREGTDTPVRVWHRMNVEVLYRERAEWEVEIGEEAGAGGAGGLGGEGERGRAGVGRAVKGKGKSKERNGGEVPELRKIRVSKPLELYSCLNFLDSLTLPRYTLDDPNPLSPDGGMDVKVPCVCGMTLQELLNKHANVLLSPFTRPSGLPMPSSSSASTSARPSTSTSPSLSPHPLPSSLAELDLPLFHPKPDSERAALSPAGTASRMGVTVVRGVVTEGSGSRNGSRSRAGGVAGEGGEGEDGEERLEWEWRDEKVG